MTEDHTDLATAMGEDTFLAQMPPEARSRLLSGAPIVKVARGETIFSATEAADRVGVVVDGLARTYLTAGDGRRLTVRFARQGDTIGSIRAPRGALSAQAVSDCTILHLDGPTLGALMLEDGRVGMAFVVDMARRMVDVYATLAANTFGTMRERVARQLLDVATETSEDAGPVASLTQQGLADGVGTVREVVARVLREFREEGLVRTTAGQIEIVDPDGLAAIVGRSSSNHRRWPLDETGERKGR